MKRSSAPPDELDLELLPEGDGVDADPWLLRLRRRHKGRPWFGDAPGAEPVRGPTQRRALG